MSTQIKYQYINQNQFREYLKDPKKPVAKNTIVLNEEGKPLCIYLRRRWNSWDRYQHKCEEAEMELPYAFEME